MNKLDLFILPLNLQGGQEEPGLPGLIAAAAPRRAERSRREDLLVLNMHLSGSRVPAPTIQESIVSQMVEPYFRSRGTVTNGLRAVAEQLNHFLLEQNERSTREGAQTLAQLNLAVLRRNILYLAHAGDTHSFLISAEGFLDYHEQAGLTPGLGISKHAELSFHQVNVVPGDVYMPCVEPPPSWSEESLARSQELALEGLRRKLLSLSGSYLQAAVVKFQRGEGKIVRLKPRMRYIPQEGGEIPVTQETQDELRILPGVIPAIDEPVIQPPLPEAGRQASQAQQPPTQPPAPGDKQTDPEPQPNVEEHPPQEQQKLEEEQKPPVIPPKPKLRPFAYGKEGLPTLEELLAFPDVSQAPIPPLETPAKTQRTERSEIQKPPQPTSTAAPVSTPIPAAPEQKDEESLEAPEVFPEDIPEPLPAASVSPPVSAEQREAPPEPEAVPEEPIDSLEHAFHEPFTTDIKTPEPEASRVRSDSTEATMETAQDQTEPPPSQQAEKDTYEEPDIQPFVTESSMAKPGSRDLLEKFAAASGEWFNNLKQSLDNALRKLLISDRLKRLIKDRNFDKKTGNMSVTTMIFIAIAVPLAVVGIATSVYFNSGVSDQHELYLYQAQQFALQALKSSQDQDAARESWTQAMYWLDQAEDYGRTDASRELRVQIIDALDSMEGIARLPLVSSLNHDLPTSVQVSKIIATESDAYLLDNNTGEVLRIYSSDTGFKLDTQFECGPGPSGSIIISPLIDVVELPINNRFNARVMGIDRNGNLSYCMPGDTPLTQPLSTPEVGWGKISAMALDKGNLYILDINNNAVWVYEGYNLTFTDSPRLFFDLDIPILGDVVDMEVNGDDLFLLHNDGRMSHCTFRVYDFADTKCEDPTVYGDKRGGSDLELETFPDTLFTQMLTTEPPDPSIYILDPRSTGIYHFSLMLNLQRILLPLPDKDYPIPVQAVSAFTINPNRMVFMAFGNKIYQAALP